MNNPFSTDALVPNWAKAGEILKYETAGHAFNGNQYTARSTGETRDALNSLRDRATQMAASAGKGNPVDSSMAHEKMARMHLEEAGRMRQLAASYHNPNGRSYAMEEGAAKLHEDAALAHAVAHINPSAENTLKAADATMRATSGRNAGVTDGTVILSGAEKSVVTKGDAPGHPFRGNQWQSGAEMEKATSTSHFLSTNAQNFARGIGISRGLTKPLAQIHRTTAEGIKNMVLKHSSEMTSGDRMRATRAIQAHLDAAQAHEAILDHLDKTGGQASYEKDPEAQALAQRAAIASFNADTATGTLANTHAE